MNESAENSPSADHVNGHLVEEDTEVQAAEGRLAVIEVRIKHINNLLDSLADTTTRNRRIQNEIAEENWDAIREYVEDNPEIIEEYVDQIVSDRLDEARSEIRSAASCFAGTIRSSLTDLAHQIESEGDSLADSLEEQAEDVIYDF